MATELGKPPLSHLICIQLVATNTVGKKFQCVIKNLQHGWKMSWYIVKDIQRFRAYKVASDFRASFHLPATSPPSPDMQVWPMQELTNICSIYTTLQASLMCTSFSTCWKRELCLCQTLGSTKTQSFTFIFLFYLLTFGVWRISKTLVLFLNSLDVLEWVNGESIFSGFVSFILLQCQNIFWKEEGHKKKGINPEGDC